MDPNKGKGVSLDKAHKSKDETEKPHSHLERGGSSEEDRVVEEVLLEEVCPKKNKEGGGEAHISEAQRRNVEARRSRGWNIPNVEKGSLKTRGRS
jgi:hypothetical protein